MKKNEILDLMSIIRWERRSAQLKLKKEIAAPHLIQNATEPTFISVIDNKTPTSQELDLAQAIASACQISAANHLILYAEKENIADLLKYTSYQKKGFLVFFGDIFSDSFFTHATDWIVVYTSTLNQLQNNPLLKKQLWQTLSQGLKA